MEITGNPDPMLAAAIAAALARLDEEDAVAAATPTARLVPGPWVASAMARPTPPVTPGGASRTGGDREPDETWSGP